MPKKKPKLIVLAQHIADARHIVANQLALLARLQAAREPTLEAEATLRTYISALQHLETLEHKMREEDKAKKGETLKK